jgi:hypothetical protein
MTSIWGPLGWMTLHSVSTSYPEKPTPSEKALVSSWLDMFRDTITCPHCKEHFGTMLQNYRMRFPNMLNSRQDFAMFAFRAHNAVNARLHKPIYGTLTECMNVLKANIKTRSASDYRISYINHITKYWRTIQDISGIVSLKKVNEMKKIEIDYFSSRDTKFEVELLDDNVVIPRNWVDNHVEAPRPMQTIQTQLASNANARAGFRIVGGRMRLR